MSPAIGSLQSKSPHFVGCYSGAGICLTRCSRASCLASLRRPPPRPPLGPVSLFFFLLMASWTLAVCSFSPVLVFVHGQVGSPILLHLTSLFPRTMSAQFCNVKPLLSRLPPLCFPLHGSGVHSAAPDCCPVYKQRVGSSPILTIKVL